MRSLTRRGRVTLALGGLTYLAAWAFGATALYPVSIGLVAACLLGATAVRLSSGEARVRRELGAEEHIEGDDVTVRAELDVASTLQAAPVRLLEQVGRLGLREVALRRKGGRLKSSYTLRAVPRGRYSFQGGRALVEDPFGLARSELPLRPAGALVVLPRLAEVDRLFSEAGSGPPGGGRLLLRRPSGFDLHSVREYEYGESLRKVHWPSTARRGALMVRELEDDPRDDVAVLLDAHGGGAIRSFPSSTFDVQVRVAGSILRSHLRRGRRALLVVSSAQILSVSAHSSEGDWRAALALLAAAEPTGTRSAATLIADEGGPLGRAQELAVVTAAVSRQLVDRLTARVLERRSVSLVLVDPASLATSSRSTRDPGLLRLAAAGVPVRVVRRGDDLGAVLAAPPELRRARV